MDDTLGVTKCGRGAFKLNAVINSFMAKKQEMSKDKKKNVEIYIGK